MRGGAGQGLAEVGFRRVHRWVDSQPWFAVMLASAR